VLSRSILAALGLHCEAFVGKGALPGEKCEWLGLAIGELVMNAAKHAFPGDRAGRIRIEIFACGSHWRCTISDNGVGMQDTHRGCGSRIIDSLVDALGGQLAICSAPEGTAVSIAFAA
jgi:two-component sensor histidine kinase